MLNIKKISLYASCALFVLAYGAQSFAKSVKIKSIGSQDIVEMLKSRKGEKHALLIYASWCPNCRAVMPNVLKIEKKMPGFFTAVSMDESKSKLKKYLKKQDVPFVAYKWDKKVNLTQNLKRLGIDFNRKIPFFVIFNSDGVATSQGNMKPEELATYFKL